MPDRRAYAQVKPDGSADRGVGPDRCTGRQAMPDRRAYAQVKPDGSAVRGVGPDGQTAISVARKDGLGRASDGREAQGWQLRRRSSASRSISAGSFSDWA